MNRMIRPIVLSVLAAALAAGDCRLQPMIPHRDEVLAIAASTDGVVATWDGDLRLWSATTGRLLWWRHLPGLAADRTVRLAVGSRRIVCAQAGTVVVVDRSTGRETARAGAAVLAVGADAGWLICRRPGGVEWRRTDALDAVVGTADLAGETLHAAVAADGSRAVVVSGDGRALLDLTPAGDGWRAAAHVLPAPAPTIGAGVATLPSGGPAVVLASRPSGGGRGIALSAWRLPLSGDAPMAAAAAIDDDPPRDAEVAIAGAGTGRVMVSGWGGRGAVWDLAATAVPGSRLGTDPGRSLAWLGGPEARAVGRVVDIADQGLPIAELGRAEVDGRCDALLRSSDGRLLWTSGPGGLVCWDLALLQQRANLPGEVAFPLEPAGHPRYGIWAPVGDNRWRILDLDGRRDLAAIRGQIEVRPAVSGTGGAAVAIDDGRLRAWLLPGGEAAGQADLPDWAHQTGATAVGASGDSMRALTVRFAADAAAAELRVFALPGLRQERVSTVVLDAVPGSQDDVWVRPDGDGWRLAAAGLDVRIGPDAALRDGDGAQAAPRTPAASPGSADGPWYARIPAAIDDQGLAVLGHPGAQVRLLSDGDAWAAWSDDGIFDGSRSAARMLSAELDGRAATLDEVAARWNRPDRLLRQLGCDDGVLVAAAARPADRRRDVDGQRPSLEAGPRRIEGGSLVLPVSAPGAQRIELRLDGVPATAVLVSGGRADVRVPLDQGIVSVELSAIDADGRASLRHAEPVPSVRSGAGRMVVACLGVSRYRQEGLRLNYAAKDALDLALAFADEGPRHAVRHWVDEQVVAAGFDEVRRHLAQAGPADTVVLTLAGHGLYVADPAPVWYYLPWDADAARPAETGIAWTRIASLFDGCAARRRLVVLDTCESGELEDGEPLSVPGLSVAGARGLRAPVARSQAADGLAAEFRAGDRSRFVTADLAQGIGAVVLASSRGGESSYESDADRNGLFTAELLAGLRGAADADRDGLIQADELLRWTAREVARRSGNRQHPTIDRDNPLSGIRLPVLPPQE